jgi:hypothetical protein
VCCDGEGEDDDGHVKGAWRKHTDDQVIQALRSSKHWKWHHSASSKLRRRVQVSQLPEFEALHRANPQAPIHEEKRVTDRDKQFATASVCTASLALSMRDV